MIIYPMYACVSDSSSICVLLGNVYVHMAAFNMKKY